jgi:hypothetical protein
MTIESPAAAKIEIPAVARDLAQRAVKTAKERADAMKATAEQATATVESAFNGSAATFAEMARAVQGAIHEDVTATLASVEKMTAADSLAEAARIHAEFLGERGRVGLERLRSVSDYVGKALQISVKNAEQAFAKFTPSSAEAA